MNKFSIGSGFKSSTVQNFMQSQLSDAPEATLSTSDNNQITGEDGVIYILDEAGDIKESSKPTVKGQFKKPMLWRYGTPTVEILNLNDAAHIEKYNNILAGAYEEDPSYYIIESVRQFWEGTFIIMLTWCPVLYAALMRKTK